MLTVNYEFKIEENRNKEKLIKVFIKEKEKYIGSKYDNKREIQKMMNKINDNKKKDDIFIIYGFGTGEHIKELRKKYKRNKIIVFEPNCNLMRYIDNLEWVTEDENLQILCCEKKKLLDAIEKNVNEYNYKNSEYIYFSNYNLLYRNEFIEFFQILNQYIVNIALDTNTKLKFNEKWFKNLMGIIPYVIKGIPSDLYNNKFKNIPAVIVSAGPSLSKNIDLLKKNNNMMIFCGGRTLGTLLEKGINPDLLVIADATERNYDLVKDYITNINVPMLFSESANLKIVEQHNGMKLFYSYNELIDKIIERKITHISTGGSVAHAMASYAANLGCNPIIFIGQDFAYTDNKTHDVNAQNKDNSYTFETAKRNDDIYVEDFYGKQVRTSIVLNNQRIAMEEIIKIYPRTKFINATEGGAKMKGTTQMTLKDCLLKYNFSTKRKFEKINYSVNMKKNAINVMNEFFKEMEELLQKLKNNKQDKEKWKMIINISRENNLFEMLLYKNIYEYLSTDYEKNNASLKDVINKLEWARNMVLKKILKLKNM